MDPYSGFILQEGLGIMLNLAFLSRRVKICVPQTFCVSAIVLEQILNNANCSKVARNNTLV